MNERMKQLAEQAGFFPTELTQVGPSVEKFAELIVQECVGIVENLSPGYKDYRDQIEDAFRRDCIVEIKEHLGVEL